MAKRRNDLLRPKPSYEPQDGGLLRYDRGGYSEAPQNVASLVAPGNEGDILMLEGGLAVWKTALWTSWNPDGEPASPSALDDEFNTTSLDAKWTTVNWGSASSTDVNTSVPGCLRISGVGAIAPTLICAMQSLPSGDFCVVTKAYMTGISGAISYAYAIVVADGVTAGAGSQLVVWCGEYLQYTRHVAAYAYTNYNTVGAQTGRVNYQEGITHIRLRRASGVYYLGLSVGGKTWEEEVITVAFTPTYIGLGAYLNNPTTTIAFEYFRYSNSATATFGRSEKHF